MKYAVALNFMYCNFSRIPSDVASHAGDGSGIDRPRLGSRRACEPDLVACDPSPKTFRRVLSAIPRSGKSELARPKRVRGLTADLTPRRFLAVTAWSGITRRRMVLFLRVIRGLEILLI